MLIIQNIKTIFLAALFTACVLGSVPISMAVAVDYQPDNTCSFEVSAGPYYVDEPVTFTDTSSFPQGYIREHIWEFNDGSDAENSVDATHEFTEPGNYTVNLWVTRNYVDYFTCSRTIEVLEQPIVEEPTVIDYSTPLDTPTETQPPQIDTTSTDTSTPLTNEEVTVPQDTPVSDTQNIESGISPLEIIDLTISDILPNEIAATSEVSSVTLPTTLEGNSVQGIPNEVDTQSQDTESVTLAGSYAQATI